MTDWQRDVDHFMRRSRRRKAVKYWLVMAAVAVLAGGSFLVILEWRG